MSDPAELDVDARFLLANERTLLAWQRTGLTLIAGGVAMSQLGQLRGHDLLASILTVLGCTAAAAGGLRYAAADRALRAGRIPETGRAPLVLALVVVVIGIAAAAAILVS